MQKKQEEQKRGGITPTVSGERAKDEKASKRAKPTW